MSLANIGPNLFHQKRIVVAEIDAALEEQILDVPQRQREANIHQHHQPITSGEELKHRNGLVERGLYRRITAV